MINDQQQFTYAAIYSGRIVIDNFDYEATKCVCLYDYNNFPLKIDEYIFYKTCERNYEYPRIPYSEHTFSNFPETKY